MAAIDFHAAHDMRPVADHQRGAGIDDGVGKLAKVAAVFAEK